MVRPRIVVVEPQGTVPDIERAAVGDLYDLEFHDYAGAPFDDAVYARADAWVNFRSRHRLSAAVIDKLTRCRIIVSGGVGYDHIDLNAANARGLPVCNVPDYGTTDVADAALAMVLTLVRGTAAYDNALRQDGRWVALGMPTLRRLRGLTFGVVGLGRIGLAAARRAAAFEMTVGFYDPYLPPGAELAVGFRRHSSLESLLGATDVLSIHMPLTPETHGMIDGRALEYLRPGAILINTSRGPVVDLDAVATALRNGRLQAAGLDVLPKEPADLTHPLLSAWRDREPWLLNRLVITPHAAFYSPQSVADMRRLALQTAVDFLRDGTLRARLDQAESGRRI